MPQLMKIESESMSIFEPLGHCEAGSMAKRKFDNSCPIDDEIFELGSTKLRKDKLDARNCSDDLSVEDRVGIEDGEDCQESDLNMRFSLACSVPSTSSNDSSASTLHFFVRTTQGNSMVIHANSNDSVKSIHERIWQRTKIPIFEQRFIYCGKQLQWEQSLADCCIQNDASLHLVGRMRSTEYPRSWQVVDDMISSATRLYQGDTSIQFDYFIRAVIEFLRMTPWTDIDTCLGHFQIFLNAGAPSALVMLYLSPVSGNRQYAEDAIKLFLTSNEEVLPKSCQAYCVSIVLEFCKLLRESANDSPLYIQCRGTLGSLLENIGRVTGLQFSDIQQATSIVHELFPFVSELGTKLSACFQLFLVSNSPPSITFPPCIIDDFSAFMQALIGAILDLSGVLCGPVILNGSDRVFVDGTYSDVILSLYTLFDSLLGVINKTLEKIGWLMNENDSTIGENLLFVSDQYLVILKEMYKISKFYEGAEEKCLSILRLRKIPLNSFIRHAKRKKDHRWILEHKDLTDFESRRHLLMVLFPELKEDYDELYEMLIERSELLSESFAYIKEASPQALHQGLFVEFKNEDATGPGVLREWFILVCKAIFNPHNSLFLPCPNDHRRFFPNTASVVDPLHLNYFVFSGRVIALALMHKIQVGITFDRIFFLQLAGEFVSLEDARTADPALYTSCKRILEMDADVVDSDVLGLTFVREIEELGSRRTVELCHCGGSLAVNSENRSEYVNLLIKHHFVTSISEQVSHFARGFSDILIDPILRKFFFQSLDLEDLDRMLLGNDNGICLEDWKLHTEYNGYAESDPQIYWFWKAVGNMTNEEQRSLLYFWTSVNYLPLEGFGGLPSKLCVYKVPDSHEHLPSSRTCFYRLCLPCYPSISIMCDRLHVVTQEHLRESFGLL